MNFIVKTSEWKYVGFLLHFHYLCPYKREKLTYQFHSLTEKLKTQSMNSLSGVSFQNQLQKQKKIFLKINYAFLVFKPVPIKKKSYKNNFLLYDRHKTGKKSFSKFNTIVLNALKTKKKNSKKFLGKIQIINSVLNPILLALKISQ